MQNESVDLSVDPRVTERLPSEERRKRGPYALFECFQNIPCNPCFTSCKFGAVKPMEDINCLPEVDYDKCVGCGACAAHCSGLAVFILDETYSETQTLVTFAWEYGYLPEPGSRVKAVNRKGQPVTEGTVVKIRKTSDRTMLVSIAVPDRFAQVVRGMALPVTEGNGVFDPMPENVVLDKAIVCRCEDIDMETLQKLLDENHLTLNDLKLEARFSMGPCQGKTCTALLVRELSARLHIPPEKLRGPRYRQPIRPVKLGELAGIAAEREKEE